MLQVILFIGVVKDAITAQLKDLHSIAKQKTKKASYEEV